MNHGGHILPSAILTAVGKSSFFPQFPCCHTSASQEQNFSGKIMRSRCIIKIAPSPTHPHWKKSALQFYALFCVNPQRTRIPFRKHFPGGKFSHFPARAWLMMMENSWYSKLDFWFFRSEVGERGKGRRKCSSFGKYLSLQRWVCNFPEKFKSRLGGAGVTFEPENNQKCRGREKFAPLVG